MVGDNKTFQAKVVGVVDIQADDATKTVKNLLEIQKDLNKALKSTANDAISTFGEFGAGKVKLEDVRKAVGNLAQDLKLIGIAGKSAKLLNVDDVKTAEELEKRIKAIVKAYESGVKQTKMSQGTFGLDATDPRKALSALKELENAAKAVQYAMQTRPQEAAALTKQKQIIEANTLALQKHVDTLRAQISLENAHAEALKKNAEFDKKRAKERSDTQAKAIAENIARDKAEEKRQEDSEAKKLKVFQDRMRAQREAEEKADGRRALAQQQLQYQQVNSASAQGRLSRDRFDFTPTARAAGAYQFQLQSDRASLLANPAFQMQDQLRRQRVQAEQALAEVYKNAGSRPETSGFYKTPASEANDPRRLQAAQSILNLQRELVSLQQRGQLTDADSLRLRTQITQEIAAEVAARTRAGNIQAQQNQAERNMARVRGQGGASLLAVQAALMANYSILNGFTGSIRSAISGSIELESQFRNVQAVTATTSTEMAGLEDRIKAVAASSKFSSSEVAQAALILGQAGLSARQVGQSIESVTQLAAASGTSLAQSVDLVTSIIGVFDKNASETGDIANKVTQAANSSKVSVDKLALGFQYAGNTAAQAGISFEETTAAMAAMSNAGIRSGSTMGTGLRQFITETQKPSQEFLDTMSRIGLSMTDLDFKSHGLVGVARKLREAGFIASDAIKSFDVRGAAAFNALIADPDALETQYRGLLNTKAGLKANEVQMDSLQSQSARLKTSLINLASEGFQPTSAFLQLVADKTATVVQWMAEHETVARTLGTVLAGTLASAMALHVASLARGAIAMLSFTSAATGASGAITVLGAAQAVAARWSALWAGLGGAMAAVQAAFTSTAAAATVSATAGTVAMNGLATAVARTTMAVEALWAGFLASPLLPVVAVLGIAAGAYYMLSDSSKKAREEIDKAKASADEAKGAYEEKARAIDSLNNRISELNYKQKETNVSQEELRNTGMTLNAQFGALGLSIDSNTRSYGEMITKMKQVRTEMEGLADAKLSVAQSKNRELEATQTKDVQSAYDSLRGNGLQAFDIAARNSKTLTPQQKATLNRTSDSFAAGNLSNVTDLENSRAIMSGISQELRNSGWGGSSSADKLDKFLGNMDQYIRKISELKITQAEGSDLGVKKANNKDAIAYRQRTFSVDNQKMSLENVLDSLGGNIRAKAPATGDRLKDFDSFKELADKEMAQLSQVKDQVERDQRNPNTNKQVVADSLIAIRQRIEGIKTDVRNFATETQAKAEREYKNESMRLNAIIGSSKALSKEDRAQAQRDKAELDKKFKTRAIIDKDEKYNAEQAIEDTGEIKAANILAGKDRTAKDRTKEIEAGIRERVLKAQEAAALRGAEADKMEAGISQDLDLVQKLWEEGLAKIGEARGYAIQAVKERQLKDKEHFKGKIPAGMDVVWKEELATVNSSFDQQVRQFTDSFKGFANSVALTLKKFEDIINRRKQDIEDQKIAGEDRVYSESGRLRELELMQALGKKARDRTFQTSTKYDYGSAQGSLAKGTADNMAVSTTIGPKGVTVAAGGVGSNGGSFGGGVASARGNSSGVGSADELNLGFNAGGGGTLKQRISKENIRIGKIELEESDKYLESLGQLIKDLETRYKAAKEAFDRTAQRIQELEEKEKSTGLSAPEREELSKARGNYKEQSDYVKNAQKDYNTSVRDRRTARKDNNDIQTKIAKYSEELPTDLTLDSVRTKIEDVVSTWQDAVKEMDATKVLGDGAAAILGGITGQLGNGISSILSGTKTIKSAVKDMAVSVIKSMLDIASQMAAIQAMKGLMNFFGGSAGLGGLGSLGSLGSTDVSSLASTFGNFAAASGGYVTPQGGIKRFASGGQVTGGVEGKDSVPAVVMPGEFILKKTAVDAVGTDYLHSLNKASSDVVSSASAKIADTKQESSVVNVWVVSPDQQPSSLGPKDVIATVTDDITRGGSVKKLIKQIQNGQI